MKLESAAAALAHWSLSGSEISLHAHRENTVFSVRASNGKRYALRAHRQGYQTLDALVSELVWMQHLHSTGMRVPVPVTSVQDELLVQHDGYAIDLLTWLDGEPLGTSGQPLHCVDRAGTFYALGKTLASLHTESDNWSTPTDFERCAWDLDGLIGETPLWGCALDSPALSDAERLVLSKATETARDELARSQLDYGLIHADAVPENVLLSDSGLALIDFDDSGYGYRLFDIATALIKHRAEPDFDDLGCALISGYRSLRPLDTTHLPAFYWLRAQTYIGWIAARIDEPGAEPRQARVIDAAVAFARRYLQEVAR